MSEWMPIKTAFDEIPILKGEISILAVDSSVSGGFYQVVYWNDEHGTGYGWETMDQEIRYHASFFTHWMFLEEPPVNTSEKS